MRKTMVKARFFILIFLILPLAPARPARAADEIGNLLNSLPPLPPAERADPINDLLNSLREGHPTGEGPDAIERLLQSLPSQPTTSTAPTESPASRVREVFDTLPDETAEPDYGEDAEEAAIDLEDAKGHPIEYYERLKEQAEPKAVKPIEADAACEKKNSVLNEEMQKALSQSPQSAFVSNDSLSFEIKPECLRDSMGAAWWASKSRFASCESKATASTNPIPCLNDTYVKGVQAGLEGALHCMKNLPPSANLLKTMDVGSVDDYASDRAEMIVSMFKKESGFNVMAKSGTGAMGPAQLTASAIQQINSESFQFKYSQLHTYFKQSKDPLCNSLQEMFAPGRELHVSACDRVDLKNGNPLKNIIYGVANVLDSEQQIAAKLKSGPGKSLLDNLGPRDRGRMLSTLAVWAHNTGAGRLRDALDQLKNPAEVSTMSFDKRLRAVSEALQRATDVAKVNALLNSSDLKTRITIKDANALKKYIAEAPAEDCEQTRSKLVKSRKGSLSRNCEVSLYVPDMRQEFKALEASHGDCLTYSPKAKASSSTPKASPAKNAAPQSIEDLLRQDQ